MLGPHPTKKSPVGRGMCVLTPSKSLKEKGSRAVTAAREPYSFPGDPHPQGAVLGAGWTQRTVCVPARLPLRTQISCFWSSRRPTWAARPREKGYL